MWKNIQSNEVLTGCKNMKRKKKDKYQLNVFYLKQTQNLNVIKNLCAVVPADKPKAIFF